MAPRKITPYGRFLLLIAGLGGLLSGVDIGIVSSALLYMNKTVELTEQQTSFIVAAVLAGGMGSSLLCGILADRLGRKKLMVGSALFLASGLATVVASSGFAALFAGRLMQGMSIGAIGVAAPLFLAECLDPSNRGKGTAIFQFSLTFGIVAASLTGFFFIHRAEAAIAAAGGNEALIRATQNMAWRGMFLSILCPALFFLLGTFFLGESPRWLFSRGRKEEARVALQRTCSAQEAELELQEMAATTAISSLGHQASAGSLLRRKYVVPFVLTCVILGCNQATGISSILRFLALIFQEAGMSASLASWGDLAVKTLNCLMTLVAVALVDRKGRKFLLKLGTSGIVIALLLAAFAFGSFEAKRIDVRPQIQARISDNRIHLPLSEAAFASRASDQPTCLTVLYSYGKGDRLATVPSNSSNPALSIDPPEGNHGPLTIRRAQYGPIPSPVTGWLVALFIGAYVAMFSVGPGVCAWLALTELMPTRIRSTGMGVALLINSCVSTFIAAVFLHTVGTYGYSTMFLVLAGCTVIYFFTVTFFLPETKGKTLEEIEAYFEGRKLG